MADIENENNHNDDDNNNNIANNGDKSSFSSSSSASSSSSSSSQRNESKERERRGDSLRDSKDSSSRKQHSSSTSSSSASSRDKDKKKDDRREGTKERDKKKDSSVATSSSKRRRSRSRGGSRDSSRDRRRRDRRRSRSRDRNDKARRRSKSRSRSRSKERRRRTSGSPRKKTSSSPRSRSHSRSRSPSKRGGKPSPSLSSSSSSLSKKDDSDGGGSSEDRKRRRSGWDTVPSIAGTTDAAKNQAAKTLPLPTTPALLIQNSAALLAAQQQQLVAQQQAAAQAAIQRTSAMQSRIYVGSLNFELTEDEIKLAFLPFGPIKQINLAKDPLTGKSKGFAFIEYAYPEAAQSALEHMNGFQLGGRPIKVGRPSHMMLMQSGITLPGAAPLTQSLPFASPAQAPVSPVLLALQAAKPVTPLPLPILGATPAGIPLSLLPTIGKATSASTNNVATAANRIYIGSVPWDITENEIKTVFQPFGEIKSCSMMPNPETGKHKGFGFVEFDNKESAEEAIKHMNGLILGGRAIKVGRAVTAQSGTSPNGAVPVPPINVALHNAAQVASSIASQLALQKKEEDSLSKEENMTISGKDRYLVMQKLARGADMKTSRCIVLHNMVTVDEVDEDLENEVSEECGKFGEVERVVIYQDHQSDTPKDVIVKIYVIFKVLESAHKALAALNNRWFGGRIVRAELAQDTPFRI